MPMIKSSKSVKREYPTEEEIKKFFYHRKVGTLSNSGYFMNVYPPAQVKVRFKEGPMHGVDKADSYIINVPWHVFSALLYFSDRSVILKKCNLFFFNEEPKSIDHVPCYASLPNIHDSSKICFGSYRPSYRAKVDRYLLHLHRNFWLSTFTSDIGVNTDAIPEGLDYKYHERDLRWVNLGRYMRALAKAAKDDVKLKWRMMPEKMEYYLRSPW